jgi:hypothetical protein
LRQGLLALGVAGVADALLSGGVAGEGRPGGMAGRPGEAAAFDAAEADGSASDTGAPAGALDCAVPGIRDGISVGGTGPAGVVAGGDRVAGVVEDPSDRVGDPVAPVAVPAPDEGEGAVTTADPAAVAPPVSAGTTADGFGVVSTVGVAAGGDDAAPADAGAAAPGPAPGLPEEAVAGAAAAPACTPGGTRSAGPAGPGAPGVFAAALDAAGGNPG